MPNAHLSGESSDVYAVFRSAHKFRADWADFMVSADLGDEETRKLPRPVETGVIEISLDVFQYRVSAPI